MLCEAFRFVAGAAPKQPAPKPAGGKAPAPAKAKPQKAAKGAKVAEAAADEDDQEAAEAGADDGDAADDSDALPAAGQETSSDDGVLHVHPSWEVRLLHASYPFQRASLSPRNLKSRRCVRVRAAAVHCVCVMCMSN